MRYRKSEGLYRAYSIKNSVHRLGHVLFCRFWFVYELSSLLHVHEHVHYKYVVKRYES